MSHFFKSHASNPTFRILMTLFPGIEWKYYGIYGAFRWERANSSRLQNFANIYLVSGSPSHMMTLSVCCCVFSDWSLQWRHNERDGVSNQRRFDCLLNRLFGRRAKKTSKLRVTGLCEGKPPVTGDFPHKGSVTRKMFPFDNVLMPGFNTNDLTLAYNYKW